MAIVDSVWHLINAVLIFFSGAILVALTARYFKLPQRRVLFLYFWHSIFCVIYMFYSLNNIADSTLYYVNGEFFPENLSLGTRFVEFLVYLVRLLDVSYFGVFLVFNVFGSLGLISFYASLNKISVNGSVFIKRLALIIVLLPSVSFWSSAIGKDPLSFLSIGLALWAALEFEKRVVLMSISIVIMLLVRPHIAALLLMAVVIAILLHRRTKLSKKIVIGGLSLVVATVMVPFAMQYSGLGDAESLNDVQSYIDKRQGYNQSGGGGVDISSMSLPVKLFTYLLRPLPYEARSIPALAASIDNFVLFAIILYYLYIKIRFNNVRSYALPGNRIFMWVYVIISWYLLANTTANLGISVRQKWMFVPILIFLLVSFLSTRKARVKKNSPV